jgi:hypothetical protein
MNLQEVFDRPCSSSDVCRQPRRLDRLDPGPVDPQARHGATASMPCSRSAALTLGPAEPTNDSVTNTFASNSRAASRRRSSGITAASRLRQTTKADELGYSDRSAAADRSCGWSSGRIKHHDRHRPPLPARRTPDASDTADFAADFSWTKGGLREPDSAGLCRSELSEVRLCRRRRKFSDVASSERAVPYEGLCEHVEDAEVLRRSTARACQSDACAVAFVGIECLGHRVQPLRS